MPRPKRDARTTPELITRSEAARRKGISRPAVTVACRGPLAEAVVGTKLDATHPSFVLWLDEVPRGPPPTSRVGPTAPVTREEMITLRKRKLEAEARKLELANDQKAGSLISREFVKTHLFGLIDGTNRRLLGDGAKSLALRAFGMVKSGATLEELQREVRDQISKQLARVKGEAQRKLARAPSDTTETPSTLPKKKRKK